MKTVIWVAAIGAVAGSLLSWVNFVAAENARAAQADINAKAASVTAGIARMHERVSIEEKKLAELNASFNLARAETNKTTSPTTPQKLFKGSIVHDAGDVLLAHPELRGLFRQHVRANLTVDYLPFYHAARLAPEQIAKFEDLMADAEERTMDVRAAARAKGLTWTDPVVSKLIQQINDELRPAQTAVLGADGYQLLQNFNQTEPQRMVVNDITARFASTTTPFSEEQREQLLSVLTKYSKASASAQPSAPGKMAKLLSTDWAGALLEAQTFLSPAQIAAVKAYSLQPHYEAMMREFSAKGP